MPNPKISTARVPHGMSRIASEAQYGCGVIWSELLLITESGLAEIADGRKP